MWGAGEEEGERGRAQVRERERNDREYCEHERASQKTRCAEGRAGRAGEEKQRATRRNIFAPKQKDTHAETARDTRRIKRKETHNALQCNGNTRGIKYQTEQDSNGNTHADTHACGNGRRIEAPAVGRQ